MFNIEGAQFGWHRAVGRPGKAGPPMISSRPINCLMTALCDNASGSAAGLVEPRLATASNTCNAVIDGNCLRPDTVTLRLVHLRRPRKSELASRFCHRARLTSLVEVTPRVTVDATVTKKEKKMSELTQIWGRQSNPDPLKHSPIFLSRYNPPIPGFTAHMWRIPVHMPRS